MIKKVSMILRKVTEYLGIEELIYANVNEEEELSNKEKDVYTQKRTKKQKCLLSTKKNNFTPQKKESYMENAIKKELDYILHKVIDCLGIDELKVEYGDMIEDSVLDIKRNAIVINNQYRNNYYESAKCVVHEARHAFQLFYIILIDDERSKRWRKSMENYMRPSKDDLSGDYELQEVEIDAYAFTKYFLRKEESIDVIHKNLDYDKIIDAYIGQNKEFYEECCSIEKG